jgi:N-acetylglucosamine-6-phosphate deacetylase
MIVLSGADLVLPDRLVAAGTLVLSEGRIVSIHADGRADVPSSFAFHGHTIVPGFIDVHVHGVDGTDTLDDGDAVARIAASLPRVGVTAFCPTTVACAPVDLQRVLAQVRNCRQTPDSLAARVLPAHLESNFINPAYRGAQPAACLRSNAQSHAAVHHDGPAESDDPSELGIRPAASSAFTADDLRQVMHQCAPDIAIVTMAPEIDGGMALLSWLVDQGIRVSIGHSGAGYQETLAAIAGGARQVTHLFNAMPPIHHRRPGLVGVALQSGEVAVELICDGVHVHPVMVRMVVAAKGASRILAISDATAAAGLPPGATASLGGQVIRASDTCAVLPDGTLAGSTTTLDEAFRRLTREMGVSLVDAAHMCATTPARELGLVGHGVIAEGAVADLTILDPHGTVVQTYIGGKLAYSRGAHNGNSGVHPSV